MDELAKWSFVAPWCADLRGRVAIERRSHPHSLRSSFAWLRVPLPADGKGDNWRRIQWCREAVELFGTIALFDANAFCALLREKCMLHMGHDLDAHVLRPRFSFVFSQYMNLDISWGSTLYNQFFLALDHESMSDEFRDAMDQVRRIRDSSAASRSPATSRDRESRSHARIPVQITFQPPELPPHWSVQYLKSVLETVHAIRDESDCSTSGGDHAFPFALESVYLNVNQVTLTKKAVDVLRELLAVGVQIPFLSLHPSTAIAKAPRDCMGEFISTLTRCALHSASVPYATDGNDAVDAILNPRRRDTSDATLRVRGPGVDSQQFGAFCSAMASSKDIRSVHLSNVFAEERGYHRFRKWQWAAYAFFWRESTSQISALRVDDSCLRQEDVLALSSILGARYPARQLVGREVHSVFTNDHPEVEDADPNDSDDEIVSVLVNKGARVAIDPDDLYGRKSFMLESEDHFLVMKDDEESDLVDILVPGYAHCAVERESIQYYLRDSKSSAVAPPLKDAAREAPSVARHITSLDIEVKEVVQAEILQAFIELVGSPLTSLVLKARALSSETLGVILNSCPRLQRLTIDIVEEQSLEVLAQAYKDGVCAISALSLQGLELDSDEVTDFAQAIGNKEGVLAQTLEELSIGEFIESYALDEANLSALLVMLESNRKIEFLELYVEHALYDNFLPLFMEFHGQELPVMKEPMPLSCRLAFLSVIQHFNNTEEEDSHARSLNPDEAHRTAKKARRQSTNSNVSTAGLDRHVVSLIFQFAAIPKKRVVRLVDFH